MFIYNLIGFGKQSWQWLENQYRVDNFCWQTPILMKLVSVGRALKELQNDILFVRLYSTGTAL